MKQDKDTQLLNVSKQNLNVHCLGYTQEVFKDASCSQRAEIQPGVSWENVATSDLNLQIT